METGSVWRSGYGNNSAKLDNWHDVIGEPTFADAILDRIVHNAHRINLDGPSMRKTIAENFNANDVDHAERK